MRLTLLCLALAIKLTATDLNLPPFSIQGPQPSKRASVTTVEYAGTQVRHIIALPDDWSPDWQALGKRWPVIAEYTGNYFPISGSTGEVEGAALGYGIAQGRAIWVVLPYISKDRTKNERTWWGDIDATVDYAKTNLPRICAEFGGDPRKIVLCGFSRGAIGVSFLGLHDDEIAKLWCGFWAHDHFDGVMEWKGQAWGYPLARYRKEAAIRLRRLAGRPLLVTQGGEETKKFIESITQTNIQHLTIDIKTHYAAFPNAVSIHPHNDQWPLFNGPATDALRTWFQRVIR